MLRIRTQLTILLACSAVQAVDTFGLVGQTLDGHIQVLAAVGHGGFSVVYRGHHLGLNAPVAVKCLRLPPGLPPELEGKFLQRFREESRLLYRLSQGSLDIVRSITAGTFVYRGNATPFMVLEWLEGRPLAAEFEARRHAGARGVAPDEMLNILASAAAGVGFAHRQGVIHRDLNPGNLFLHCSAQGTRLKVLDFGVAKLVSDHAIELGQRAPTMGQFKIFAPAYGAPEQFDERVGESGPWTDVYAFALVAVEMLRDLPAVQASSFGGYALAALSAHSRPTPRALGCNVTPEVESVFARALALEPRHRFQNLDEFWRALDASIRVGKGVSAQPTTPAPVLPDVYSALGTDRPGEPETVIRGRDEVSELVARARAVGLALNNASETLAQPQDPFARTLPQDGVYTTHPADNEPLTIIDPPVAPGIGAQDPHLLAVGVAGALAQIEGELDAPRATARGLSPRHPSEPSHLSPLASGQSASSVRAAMPAQPSFGAQTLAMGSGHYPADLRAVGHDALAEAVNSVSVATLAAASMALAKTAEFVQRTPVEPVVVTPPPAIDLQVAALPQVDSLQVVPAPKIAGGVGPAAFHFDPRTLASSQPLGMLAPPSDFAAPAIQAGQMDAESPRVSTGAPLTPTRLVRPVSPGLGGSAGVSRVRLLLAGLAITLFTVVAVVVWRQLAQKPSAAQLAAPAGTVAGQALVSPQSDPRGLDNGGVPSGASTSGDVTSLTSTATVGNDALPIAAGVTIAAGGNSGVNTAATALEPTVSPEATVVHVAPTPNAVTIAPVVRSSAATASTTVTAAAGTAVAIKVSANASAAATSPAGEFDVAAARAKLNGLASVLPSLCSQRDGVHGNGTASVQFAPNGTVSGVGLGVPFANTKQGACVTGLLSRANVAPFTKGTGRVPIGFTL